MALDRTCGLALSGLVPALTLLALSALLAWTPAALGDGPREDRNPPVEAQERSDRSAGATVTASIPAPEPGAGPPVARAWLRLVVVLTASALALSVATLTVSVAIWCQLRSPSLLNERSVLINSGEKIGRILDAVCPRDGEPLPPGAAKTRRGLPELVKMADVLTARIPSKLDRQFFDQVLAEAKASRTEPACDERALAEIQTKLKVAEDRWKKQVEVSAGLEKALDEKRRELAQIQEERKEVQKLRDELERDNRVHEETRAAWDKEKRLIEERAEKTRREARELQERANAELSRSAEELREAERARAEASARANAAASDRDAANRSLAEAKALNEATAAERARVEAIREYFWPAFFRPDGALGDWRGRLESQGLRPDSSAPLLINSLHRYSLLRASGTGRVSEEVLQEIGRQAYRTWAEEGLSSEEQKKQAERWTRAFLHDLGGAFEFGIVEIGQPKDSSWMSYPFSGGSSPVAKVETWYVKGPRSTLKAVVE